MLLNSDTSTKDKPNEWPVINVKMYFCLNVVLSPLYLSVGNTYYGISMGNRINTDS